MKRIGRFIAYSISIFLIAVIVVFLIICYFGGDSIHSLELMHRKRIQANKILALTDKVVTKVDRARINTQVYTIIDCYNVRPHLK